MSRSTIARSDDAGSAVAAALADVLGVDPDQVQVRVNAPGLESLRGRVTLELDLVAATPAEAQDAGSEAREEETDETPESSARDDATEGGAEPAADETVGGEGSDDVEVSMEDLDAEADATADFLEGLLDALDLPGDLRIKVHDDHAEVEIAEVGSGALIGRRGQTLEAIQELVRCTLQRRFQRRARVKIDVEGYRARRMEKLLDKAEESIDRVLESGEPERLEPMDVFERKAVHQLVAQVEGLQSRSQGREPARRVVVEPAE